MKSAYGAPSLGIRANTEKTPVKMSISNRAGYRPEQPQRRLSVADADPVRAQRDEQIAIVGQRPELSEQPGPCGPRRTNDGQAFRRWAGRRRDRYSCTLDSDSAVVGIQT